MMHHLGLRLLRLLLLVAANLSPLYLIWLLWPRLLPPKPAADVMFSQIGEAITSVGTSIAMTSQILFIDLLIALILPLQHSIWTQSPVKKAILNRIGPNRERIYYVLLTGLAIIATCYLWRCSGVAAWSLPIWTLWPMRLLLVATLATQLYCTTLVGSDNLTGVEHVDAMIEQREIRSSNFQARGPYRFVRHPIALSQIFMVWATTVMYADRLVLAAVWTAWIVIATALEDKRLGTEIGATYQTYRSHAGFLWPRLSRTSQ